MHLLRISADRRRVPIGTLVLLLAVFSWGLEYKTSLYHQWRNPRASANPPAKLLTDAERCLFSKASGTGAGLVSLVRSSTEPAPAADLEREPDQFAPAPAFGSRDSILWHQPRRGRFIRPPPLA